MLCNPLVAEEGDSCPDLYFSFSIYFLIGAVLIFGLLFRSNNKSDKEKWIVGGAYVRPKPRKRTRAEKLRDAFEEIVRVMKILFGKIFRFGFVMIIGGSLRGVIRLIRRLYNFFASFMKRKDNPCDKLIADKHNSFVSEVNSPMDNFHGVENIYANGEVIGEAHKVGQDTPINKRFNPKRLSFSNACVEGVPVNNNEKLSVSVKNQRAKSHSKSKSDAIENTSSTTSMTSGLKSSVKKRLQDSPSLHESNSNIRRKSRRVSFGADQVRLIGRNYSPETNIEAMEQSQNASVSRIVKNNVSDSGVKRKSPNDVSESAMNSRKQRRLTNGRKTGKVSLLDFWQNSDGNRLQVVNSKKLKFLPSGRASLLKKPNQGNLSSRSFNNYYMSEEAVLDALTKSIEHEKFNKCSNGFNSDKASNAQNNVSANKIASIDDSDPVLSQSTTSSLNGLSTSANTSSSSFTFNSQSILGSSKKVEESSKKSSTTFSFNPRSKDGGFSLKHNSEEKSDGSTSSFTFGTDSSAKSSKEEIKKEPSSVKFTFGAQSITTSSTPQPLSSTKLSSTMKISSKNFTFGSTAKSNNNTSSGFGISAPGGVSTTNVQASSTNGFSLGSTTKVRRRSALRGRRKNR